MKCDQYVISIKPGHVGEQSERGRVPLNRRDTADWIKRVIGAVSVKIVRRAKAKRRRHDGGDAR